MPENNSKKKKQAQVAADGHIRSGKHKNFWGWRLGFAFFLLLFLFYACHPLIFSQKPAIYYDNGAGKVYESYDEADSLSMTADSAPEKQPEIIPAAYLSAHEYKLVEACLSHDLTSCFNYSYPEGFVKTDNGMSTADDIAYLLEALESVEDTDIENADEDSYKLYEETLPDNIIDDADKNSEFVHYNHKNIKDINIAIKHKPLYFGETPVIAVVIDDMGVNVGRSRDIIRLKAPLTSSFLTYGPKLQNQIEAARAAGHEIMAHVPMEPHKNLYTAPDGLTINMADDVLKKNFEVMLQKFPGIRGINNHMGSKFTENEQKMSDIMQVLARHKLFFLDSKTTPKSVGEKTARRFGVEYAHRHVFLDNNNNKEYIRKQLAQAERIARKNGYAVAIGHPKSQTYEALKTWLPTLPEKNIKLVHMSEVVKVLN